MMTGKQSSSGDLGARLRHLNEWRRGAEVEQPDPTQVGVDIDAAANEVEALRLEAQVADALRERMADILSRVAIAVRGPEPGMTMWGWADLPERVAAMRAYIDLSLERGPIYLHKFNNICPDWTNPYRRDPECEACQLLVTAIGEPRKP